MQRFGLLSTCLLILSALAPTQTMGQNLDRLKEEVLAEVATPELQKLSQEMVDMIYSFSELGFQEVWTSDYVAGILERGGFRWSEGARGCPRAT